MIKVQAKGPFSLEADTAPEFYLPAIPGLIRPWCGPSSTMSRISPPLEAAAFDDRNVSNAGPQLQACQLMIHRAQQLASTTS